MNRLLSFLLCLACCTAPLRAQSPDKLLITTGTSTRGTDGALWIYITWDAADPSVMAGRCFSVNFKTGDASSSANYVRQAVVKPLSRDAWTAGNTQPGNQLLQSFITRGRCLGENMTQLDSLLADGLRGLSTPPPDLPATRVERLAALLAKNDANTRNEILPMARRLSPSVAMSLGLAWAGPVSVAQGAPVTVELREHDAASSTDRGVVGRVTLNVTGTGDLPAAGAPVQMPDLTSTGDLNIQMRWGFPLDLARRQAQLQGFTVWRVAKALGAAQPWIGTQPTLAQLTTLAQANPALVKQRFSLPRREAATLTEAQAADVVTDKETVFYVDDNDRYRNGGAPFADGEEHYYFAATHDLLGRITAISRGTLMLACRCLPPPVPQELEVIERTNDTATGATAGALERVITWTPNTNTALDRTDAYQVFRSTTSASFLDEAPAGTPAPLLLGTVNHGAAADWRDASALPTDAAVYWYSVRAVHNGPRGPLYSSYSPGAPWASRPIAAVSAPAPAQTFSAPFCDRVMIEKTGYTLISNTTRPVGTVRVILSRLSTDIAWVDASPVQFFFLGEPVYGSPERIYFDRGEATTTWSFTNTGTFNFGLTATNAGGVRSRTLLVSREAIPTGSQSVQISVRMKTIPADAISTTNTEAASLLGAPVTVAPSAVTPLASDPNLSVMVLPGSVPSGDVFVYSEVIGLGFQFNWPLGLAKVWNGKAVITRNPWQALNYYVRTVSGDPDSCASGFHNLQSPGSTKSNPVRLGFSAPAGMREYRVYRRVEGGELSLIKHGELNLPAGTPVALEDVGLPATAACLDYYVQTFDQDGNSSPLQRLGQCVQIVAPLPAPTVGTPTYTGDNTTARVVLRWTAPPTGVERFEIMADPDDGGEADPDDGGEADPDDGGEIFVRPTAPGLSTIKDMLQQTGQTSLANVIFGSRDSDTGGIRRRPVSPASIFLTPLIGTGPGALGAGPVYEQSFNVQPGVKYRFTVTALGPSSGKVHARSPMSTAVRAIWAPPPPTPTEDCVLPWPFRGLPPVTKFHPDVVARRFVPLTSAGETATNVQGEHPVWPYVRDDAPVGVRIGRIIDVPYDDIDVDWIHPRLGRLEGQGTGTRDDDYVQFFTNAFADPRHVTLENAVFTGKARASQKGAPLFPVVMYRRQIANTAYPAPPDTVVQCSPLIHGIATQSNASGPRLRDPYIGLTAINLAAAQLPDIIGPFNSPTSAPTQVNFYILDTKPVLGGARYQYYLVRFASSEPDDVIDAGTVDIPE